MGVELTEVLVTLCYYINVDWNILKDNLKLSNEDLMIILSNMIYELFTLLNNKPDKTEALFKTKFVNL